MNKLIQLKGQLTPRKNPSQGGGTKLPVGTIVKATELESIKKDLIDLNDFWKKNQNIIEGALINVHYNRIVPKSKRIKTILFKKSSQKEMVDSIRGAKYEKKEGKLVHVITYYVPVDNILCNIEKIEECIKILKDNFENKFDNKDEETVKDMDFSKYKVSKTVFLQVIGDCSIVDKLIKPEFDRKIEDSQAITLYEVNKTTKEILDSIGVRWKEYSILDDNTVIVYREALQLLTKEAPYLISMVAEDDEEIELPENDFYDEECKDELISKNIANFPNPTDEPFIGVLDTGFDKRVYFEKWVDYNEDYMNKEIEITEEDREHGTAVDSIIVDGPSINPEYDDGCGRFRVKHFCVAHKGRNSVFSVMRNIEEIVKNNLDIKVWNLSLGSNLEINENFISQEAALLDMLEYKYDVIFVVAGTNQTKEQLQKKIGSPADSINSLVVNSVKRNEKKASYSRRGKVLSFFTKPDVCYYGGDEKEKMRTCIATGENMTMGTSISAPWVSRKMGYLIYKLGLSRQIAKALIIDSATRWEKVDYEKSEYYGFGCVPMRIEDIINSPKDEIKFFIEGESTDYDVYTYEIPVPIDNNKCPYIAKATLCYFPKCTRNQGVDYTNTELDLYFGRILKNKKGNITIKTINDNKQADEDGRVLEEDARKEKGKWDNVKHIVEEYKTNAKPKKLYENTSWGLSIKSKDRLGNGDGKGIKFGVVITLKEINGVNRYDEFIRQCKLKGWIVNRIDVENRLELYNLAEQEIKFE